MTIRIISILAILLLTACSSIDYQKKDDWTPEGYTDKLIEDNIFEVSFQTYRKGDHFPVIRKLALKRAAEISLSHNKSYFIIRDEQQIKEPILVNIPEHISRYQSRIDKDLPMIEVETIIPAHNKNYLIQEIRLIVELTDDAGNNALFAKEQI